MSYIDTRRVVYELDSSLSRRATVHIFRQSIVLLTHYCHYDTVSYDALFKLNHCYNTQ